MKFKISPPILILSLIWGVISNLVLGLSFFMADGVACDYPSWSLLGIWECASGPGKVFILMFLPGLVIVADAYLRLFAVHILQLDQWSGLGGVIFSVASWVSMVFSVIVAYVILSVARRFVGWIAQKAEERIGMRHTA